jgi:hypothetical protein
VHKQELFIEKYSSPSDVKKLQMVYKDGQNLSFWARKDLLITFFD